MPIPMNDPKSGPPQSAEQGAQDQAQDQAQQQSSGGGVEQLLGQTQQGLTQLLQLVTKSQLPDQDKQAIQTIAQGFDAFVQSLKQPQGQDQGPQQPPASGNVSPETMGRPSQQAM